MQIDIITRDDCKFCVLAKKLLEEKHMDYTEIKIGRDISRDTVIETYKHNFSEEKVTVPIILIDKAFLGGYNSLQQMVGGS